jgi:eukaryotic-like serine/threonine-protein kinase
MMLAPGTRLGSFEMLDALGAGGMGEVWRARDTTLQRDVAIKVLPDSVAARPDRLGRFRREAQLLAALNHPNIASIYGIEEAQGTPALVLELVEGPTLADRIAQGPIPVAEVLSIAKQIADAIEAAHAQGIVHRDLKPSNIKVKRDGTVKVLDFGLAKALEPSVEAAGADVATVTSPAMTVAGVILGTAAYMSPEQARGEVADARADVWAYGCVVFEMLTGSRVFEGRTVSDVIAAVLTSAPLWDRLPATLHPRIRLMLERCL